MDLRRSLWSLLKILLSATIVMLLIGPQLLMASDNLVFKVQNKFAGKREKELEALKAHDFHRRTRHLSAIDIPLGGNTQPTGLYFTKIKLGTPSRDYHVQIDTGSDLLWVNCAGCISCPKKSDLFKLSLYDPKASSTAKYVTCNDRFCSYINQRSLCYTTCEYNIQYQDGCSSSGYLVEDVINLDLVTGNNQTGTISFGCGTKQSGELNQPTNAVDGIIGFGKSNLSFISQLASQGKIKRSFAHCLDNNNGGGGIFTIGEVVSPKVITTPMLSTSPSDYIINLNSIKVGNTVLEADYKVIFDSGTTLAYLPDVVYKPLINEILATHPQLIVQDYLACFSYPNNRRLDWFPPVTFQFNKSSLTVYPHEYLFRSEDNKLCIGWQNGGEEPLINLGDMALSNKLVVYDIENQVIGWTNHNCSRGIQVRDEESGAIYTVGAHNLPVSSSLAITKLFTLISLLILLFCYIALYFTIFSRHFL